MRAIYIILVGLPCWVRLSRWIPLRVALPNSWWWISFTDLGLSVNCNGARPSAKFSEWGSAIGQIPVAFGRLSWVFNDLGLSAKSPKGLGPRSLGQVFKGSRLSVTRADWLGIGQPGGSQSRPVPVHNPSITHPYLIWFVTLQWEMLQFIT